jgi:hypothetical protein
MRSTGIKISKSVCKICALLEIVVWMRFELTRNMYKYEGIMPKRQNDAKTINAIVFPPEAPTLPQDCPFGILPPSRKLPHPT